MSVGDPGPYMNDEGDVWVPRTVPYLEARNIAKEAMDDYIERLVYEGKTMGTLYGFTRDCQCEAFCALEYDEDERETNDRTCEVPVWAFHLVER